MLIMSGFNRETDVCPTRLLNFPNSAEVSSMHLRRRIFLEVSELMKGSMDMATTPGMSVAYNI